MNTKKITDKDILKRVKKPDEWEFFEDYNVKHPSTKIYRNLLTNERIAVCQGLPKVKAEGRKIEVGWLYAKDKYYSRANRFSAVVDGQQIKVSIGLKSAIWNPQVFLNGVEKPCSPNPALIDDPYNSNYHQNVLEWDYGICKRRLRVIEGAILGKWIFASNPNGEVGIRYNQTGDLRLRLGQYAVSDDEELIPQSVFDEAEYPFEVGDSLTVYSTSSDGRARRYYDAIWDDCHDAALGTDVLASQTSDTPRTSHSTGAGGYHLSRGFLYFDTSVLGAGAVVSAATLSLYGVNSGSPDATDADLGIVEGVQSDPFDTADYGDHLLKTTLGAAYYAQATWSTIAYNDKALNATGYGWISLTATTKFCLRVRGDIADTTCSDDVTNYCQYYTNEQGAGYLPKLVITYTAVTKQAVGQGAITPTGALSTTLKIFQSVGDGAITPSGTLGRNIFISVGAGSITPSGVLGRLIKIVVGAGAITPTGALGTILKIFKTVGEGAVTPVGVLGRKIAIAIGSGAITPAGTLGRKIFITIGQGAITPAGTLGRKIAVAIGSGAITPIGTLGRKIAIAVGAGSVTPSGALGRFIKITMGQGAITPTGALSSILTIFKNVGQGAITPTGTLSSVLTIFKNVGQGAITPTGSLYYGIVRRIRVYVITANYRGAKVITSAYRRVKSITTRGLLGDISNLLKGG